jgi:hypothetical protein
MSTLVDNPFQGVAVVVLASIVLFAPTIVGRFRRIRAFRSVSALNALTLFLAVCFVVPGFFIGGFSPPVLWVTLAIWLISATWSVTGKRRVS